MIECNVKFSGTGYLTLANQGMISFEEAGSKKEVIEHFQSLKK